MAPLSPDSRPIPPAARRRQRANRALRQLAALAISLASCILAHGAEVRPATGKPLSSPGTVLGAQAWADVERAVDRGLGYLSSQQHPDGSFPTHSSGQPAVTGLCVMAFLSRGHTPDNGPFASTLERAIDYVLSTQRDDGMLCLDKPAGPWGQNLATHTGLYNHAIAGTMLAEVYGAAVSDKNPRIRRAIIDAIAFTRRIQSAKKQKEIDHGGWRYPVPYLTNDSDMSVTSWHLMFLRSARNAEFDIPENYVAEAMAYVKRHFDRNFKGFVYAESERRSSGGVVGGGILALALGGEHESDMARQGGDWILAQRPRPYNRGGNHGSDRYHYSVFYCSQAMFQLGGKYWAAFYPPLAATLTANQKANGAWPAEALRDGIYGDCYSSSLAILSLTPPYQLLPIYQR